MMMKLGASEAALANDTKPAARNALRVDSLSRVASFM